MSTSTWDAMRVQIKAAQRTDGRDLAREAWADQETARRINAALGLPASGGMTAALDEAARAYDHISHGCPNGWPDAPCPTCDLNLNDEECFI